MEQTIEIDCAPGGRRPNYWYAEVIKDTGLEFRQPISKCFGNWTWDYTDVPEQRWLALRPILKSRIEKLFKNNHIRYGSW